MKKGYVVRNRRCEFYRRSSAGSISFVRVVKEASSFTSYEAAHEMAKRCGSGFFVTSHTWLEGQLELPLAGAPLALGNPQEQNQT